MSRFLSLLSLVSLLGACDLFKAETSLDNVCVTLQDRNIDGVPAGGKLVRTYNYTDLSAFDGFVSLNATITDMVVGLEATRGPQNLAFLDSIHVSISAPGLPTVEVLACDASACASQTKSSTVHVEAPPNLVDYAVTGNLKVTLTVAGQLPTAEWGANLSVCLSGKAELHIGI